MLFPLDYVMESNYNLEGTKLAITKISKALYFETSITYHNIERCLYQMYKMYMKNSLGMLQDHPYQCGVLKHPH